MYPPPTLAGSHNKLNDQSLRNPWAGVVPAFRGSLLCPREQAGRARLAAARERTAGPTSIGAWHSPREREPGIDPGEPPPPPGLGRLARATNQAAFHQPPCRTQTPGTGGSQMANPQTRPRNQGFLSVRKTVPHPGTFTGNPPESEPENRNRISRKLEP